MKWAVVAMLSLLLLGCSAASMLGALTPSSGVEATAQIGADNTKAALSNQQRTTTTVSDVDGGIQVAQTIVIPWWAMLITSFGCLLINPWTMKRLFFTKDMS